VASSPEKDELLVVIGLRRHSYLHDVVGDE
jgi:hypothetical protein